MLRDLGYVPNRNASPTVQSDVPIVFVVDDDISVRESLELLIQAEGWRPGLCETAAEFLARPAPKVPNCLILDVNLPVLNGLDLQQILAERRETPIIFVTGYGDVPTSVKAMKAGALEFLTKPFDHDALLSAVHQALDRSRSTLAFQSDLHSLQERYQSLSRRERQVMSLVVSGLMNKQVGFELGISEITVKAHRGQVMRKMGAKSLPDLISKADKLGVER